MYNWNDFTTDFNKPRPYRLPSKSPFDMLDSPRNFVSVHSIAQALRLAAPLDICGPLQVASLFGRPWPRTPAVNFRPYPTQVVATPYRSPINKMLHKNSRHSLPSDFCRNGAFDYVEQ